MQAAQARPPSSLSFTGQCLLLSALGKIEVTARSTHPAGAFSLPYVPSLFQLFLLLRFPGIRPLPLVLPPWVCPLQATLPVSLIPLLVAGAHCTVLAGDPQQLPPTVLSREAQQVRRLSRTARLMRTSTVTLRH